MSSSNLDIARVSCALLEESADLAEAEQLAFIREACAHEPELLAHCLSTLECEVDDEDFIRLVYGDSQNDDEFEDLSLRSIGNYDIQSKIGSGGTADVYLAIRSNDPHRRNVALKIIRGWGNAHELQGRMMREQLILSHLKHPNVATLLDAGNADDGRPYFVLEHIKGKAITDYCNDKNLDINARLRLFIDVCSAVSAAHDERILHRDLKPTNILVTDNGVTKLLDFGIAKVLDGDSPCEAKLTQFFSPMTPQYASPEQKIQAPLSFASDQYSLGVLLYELLTRQLPYGDSTNNLLNDSTNNKVLRPSECCVKNSSKPEVSSIASQLKGDLDAVVMKAIHRDTGARYRSVKAFSDDIRRYLLNKATLAKRRSFLDRAHRLFIRKRGYATLAIASIVLTSLVTSAQQRKIVYEREQALIERVKLQNTQEHLLGLLESMAANGVSRKNRVTYEIFDRNTVPIQDAIDDRNSAIALAEHSIASGCLTREE